MIDTAALLPDLQELVKLLHADLIERSEQHGDAVKGDTVSSER